MSSAALQRMSWDEYLAAERVAEEKSEYYDGEIFAMSGGSASHSLVGANTSREAGIALKSRECQVHGSDMRVLCPSGLGTYPDCSIVCGDPEYLDDSEDTLLNPVVIFEVLSPSTEAYDRGKKFENYQTIPSLKEYVLISQDHVRIEHFARQPETGQWLLTTLSDPAEHLELPTPSISLSVSEIYSKVTFSSDRDDRSEDAGQ